ncbi:MAG: ribulose-phosphate 3-epimerase [Candidatus Wallbacteria bacterium HGW-Wallbacteria-1]|uniref:Ribulose-phosphate 3-epimerase n=1 Tax=Candidatus Wallbacteria bacterium HGW-Wallbacteria-1 TaxID=2013854 RepID=A0A2N1PVH4_9BACT|nr:MAG: ribulose-phosphate 3-epimerase [Candidatus Wallbacteria bacterium HGW-Wallbacteria-1]
MGEKLLLPSMLSADFSSLGSELENLQEQGVKAVHLDVMDGIFVPNITLGPCIIKSMRSHYSGIFDVHLMIDRPSRYIDDFIDAGADFLTLHAEAEHNLIRVFKSMEKRGVKPGIALNPETPVESLRHIVDYVDLILIMTVNPGFGGQSFMPLYEKIRAAADLLKRAGRGGVLQVDGGVNRENMVPLLDAGARWFVAGSSVFNGSRSENIAFFNKLLQDYDG